MQNVVMQAVGVIFVRNVEPDAGFLTETQKGGKRSNVSPGGEVEHRQFTITQQLCFCAWWLSWCLTTLSGQQQQHGTTLTFLLRLHYKLQKQTTEFTPRDAITPPNGRSNHLSSYSSCYLCYYNHHFITTLHHVGSISNFLHKLQRQRWPG